SDLQVGVGAGLRAPCQIVQIGGGTPAGGIVRVWVCRKKMLGNLLQGDGFGMPAGGGKQGSPQIVPQHQGSFGKASGAALPLAFQDPQRTDGTGKERTVAGRRQSGKALD